MSSSVARVSSSGDDAVPTVDLVEVDHVDAEPLEAGVRCPGEVAATRASIGGVRAGSEERLGGDHEVVEVGSGSGISR